MATPDKQILAHFRPANCRGPYVREFHSITLDPSGDKGQIEFNGYFYVKQEELPAERYLSVVEEQWVELETPIERVEPIFNCNTMREDGTTIVRQTHEAHRRKLHGLRIRILRKEEFEDTSEYSDDPEEGAICFFPTNRLRLTFAILPPSPPQSPTGDTLKGDPDMIDIE